MNLQQRLDISYYQPVAVINEAHHVDLVQHRETGKVYVRKIMDTYCTPVYQWLQEHPVSGIPSVKAIYEEDGKLTVIEDYISGTTLEEMIRARYLTKEVIGTYVCELCDILSRIHSAVPPIIHRDIKPSNVIITDYGKVFLLDFNAAKQFTGPETTDTVLIGTQGYAAPEQYGFGSSTPQTDLYALGILIKEASESVPGAEEKYRSVIEKCTRMDPAARYQSAMEVKNDLLPPQPDAVPQEPVKKTPKQKWYLLPGFRTGKFWKAIIAIPSYAFILYMSLSLQVEDVYHEAAWLERGFCLVILLGIVFCTCNYMGVQKVLPICSSKNRFLRILGVLILDTVVVFLGCILMLLIEGIFNISIT